MAELNALADAIERTVTGPMWHGPALHDVLRNVTWEDALANPIRGAHSIWELVLHVAAWANIARERLSLEPTVAPSDAQDWPAVGNATPAGWWRANNELVDGHRRLANAVRQFDTAKLGTPLADGQYTVRVMLHGVVEHGAYHGGQIALLTRTLQDRQPT